MRMTLLKFAITKFKGLPQLPLPVIDDLGIHLPVLRIKIPDPLAVDIFRVFVDCLNHPSFHSLPLNTTPKSLPRFAGELIVGIILVPPHEQIPLSCEFIVIQSDMGIPAVIIVIYEIGAINHVGSLFGGIPSNAAKHGGIDPEITISGGILVFHL